jgi:hypothetical protein
MIEHVQSLVGVIVGQVRSHADGSRRFHPWSIPTTELFRRGSLFQLSLPGGLEFTQCLHELRWNTAVCIRRWIYMSILTTTHLSKVLSLRVCVILSTWNQHEKLLYRLRTHVNRPNERHVYIRFLVLSECSTGSRLWFSEQTQNCLMHMRCFEITSGGERDLFAFRPSTYISRNIFRFGVPFHDWH